MVENRRIFLGSLLISWLVLMKFALSLYTSGDCPLRLSDRYALAFFCWGERVPINCVEPKYVRPIVLSLVPKKELARSISEHIVKEEPKDLSEIDMVKGVGPATLRKLSEFLTVGICR